MGEGVSYCTIQGGAKWKFVGGGVGEIENWGGVKMYSFYGVKMENHCQNVQFGGQNGKLRVKGYNGGSKWKIEGQRIQFGGGGQNKNSGSKGAIGVGGQN